MNRLPNWEVVLIVSHGQTSRIPGPASAGGQIRGVVAYENPVSRETTTFRAFEFEYCPGEHGFVEECTEDLRH